MCDVHPAPPLRKPLWSKDSAVPPPGGGLGARGGRPRGARGGGGRQGVRRRGSGRLGDDRKVDLDPGRYDLRHDPQYLRRAGLRRRRFGLRLGAGPCVGGVRATAGLRLELDLLQ